MLAHRVIITLVDHFVDVASTNVSAGHGVTQVYHGGKSGERATVAKSETTETLVREVIANKRGCIYALIRNDAHPAFRAPIDEAGPAKMLFNVAARRLENPEELAKTIAFCGSYKCSYISGQLVPISSG